MAFEQSPTRARFITFEGGEGVGKSTQVKRLAARLSATGRQVVRTREPGGTPKAEAVRSFLLQGKSEHWGADAEAILFAAARLDHVTALIAPALAEGKWVICDRFADSTRAYQGLTGGVEDTLIDALEELTVDGYAPDLTIVLDMDPESAFERVRQRGEEIGLTAIVDRFEKEDLDFHRRLRANFLAIAEAHPERCVVLSADRDADDLESAIWQVVRERFPELKDEGQDA